MQEPPEKTVQDGALAAPSPDPTPAISATMPEGSTGPVAPPLQQHETELRELLQAHLEALRYTHATKSDVANLHAELIAAKTEFIAVVDRVEKTLASLLNQQG